MNNDLISREALKEKLKERYYNGGLNIVTAIELIDNAPTVYPICEDKACKYRANERPQGKWIYTFFEDDEYPKCSVCGEIQKTKSNFCPDCGAQMRGNDNGTEG